MIKSLLDRPEWQARAGCRDMDTNLFFPTSSGRLPNHYLDLIGRVCTPCPVRVKCLAFGLSLDVDTPGVWGGKTARQLRRMRAEAAST